MNTPITELQCLERLSELAEIISRENWFHLYDEVDCISSKERNSLERLRELDADNKEEIKELKESLQKIKIKAMAIADLRNAMQVLIDEATSNE